ncbi:hypothetical protein CL622_05180 [archaeon]|nr:hypothetical protein [archaeon]|tara:strand:+ start:2108 stop:2332 length:225 start_codon:yes stop_codon:yes gene_type:complete
MTQESNKTLDRLLFYNAGRMLELPIYSQRLIEAEETYGLDSPEFIKAAKELRDYVTEIQVSFFPYRKKQENTDH